MLSQQASAAPMLTRFCRVLIVSGAIELGQREAVPCCGLAELLSGALARL